MIDITKWDRDGYYILPGFYTDSEIDAIRSAQENAWRGNAPRIVVDDLMTGRRGRLADVSADDRVHHRFKVNDLYLELPEIRWAELNERIVPILSKFLEQTPALCNSLSFEQGSGQPDHVDSLYMTPRTHGHLIAIWVALEDCRADAGPLRYYLGSQAIAPYIFSNGSRHFVPDEMPQWEAYMRGQVATLGLHPVTFPARKGDVFVWSANLLHGGSPVANPESTRKSLVFHYYSEHDGRGMGADLVPQAGAFWQYRAHQPADGCAGELPPSPAP